MSQQQEGNKYLHGHHASVLRSHSWRTAANSAAYLLPAIKPHMKILDVGCGPATITSDFARLVPQGEVVGLETNQSIIDTATANITDAGVTNVRFVIGDVHKLPFPDATFDVVHAHQVLQHVARPVDALREMKRVTKPGGIVAARDADYTSMCLYPNTSTLDEWKTLYTKVARSIGGEPDAGRMLHAWARVAGFPKASIDSTTSTWLFRTDEEKAWWSSLWAERLVSSNFAKSAADGKFATKDDLERIANAWREWGQEKDGWFVCIHGEILCRL